MIEIKIKYCKNCGKEIDENSIYCQHCGTKVSNERKVSANTLKEEIEISKEEKENKGNFTKIVVITLLIIALIVTAIGITKCVNDKNNSTSIITREAKNSDISIKNDNSLSFSNIIIVTPNKNIKNLKLTFSFYDNNKNLITTKTQILGNVTKGTEYSISFGLSDFSLSTLERIKSYKCEVTNGTVY